MQITVFPEETQAAKGVLHVAQHKVQMELQSDV